MLTWVGRSLIVLLTIGLSMLLVLTKQHGLVVSALAVVISIIISKINDGLVTIALLILITANILIYLLSGPDFIVPWLYVALVAVAVLLIELLLSASHDTALGDFLVLISTLLVIGLGQYLAVLLPTVEHSNVSPTVYSPPQTLGIVPNMVSAAKPQPKEPQNSSSKVTKPPTASPVLPATLPTTTAQVVDNKVVQPLPVPLPVLHAKNQEQAKSEEDRPAPRKNVALVRTQPLATPSNLDNNHRAKPTITTFDLGKWEILPVRRRVIPELSSITDLRILGNKGDISSPISKAKLAKPSVIPGEKIQQTPKETAPMANNASHLQVYSQDRQPDVLTVKVKSATPAVTTAPAEKLSEQRPRRNRPDRVIPLMLITIFCLIVI